MFRFYSNSVYLVSNSMVKTRVLPVPAPASIRKCRASERTAANCFSVIYFIKKLHGMRLAWKYVKYLVKKLLDENKVLE